MNNFTYIDPQIQKATSRVQITLPAETRDITVFDAIRDNKGKGIKATDLIKILNRTHPAV